MLSVFPRGTVMRGRGGGGEAGCRSLGRSLIRLSIYSPLLRLCLSTINPSVHISIINLSTYPPVIPLFVGPALIRQSLHPRTQPPSTHPPTINYSTHHVPVTHPPTYQPMRRASGAPVAPSTRRLVNRRPSDRCLRRKQRRPGEAAVLASLTLQLQRAVDVRCACIYLGPFPPPCILHDSGLEHRRLLLCFMSMSVFFLTDLC